MDTKTIRTSRVIGPVLKQLCEWASQKYPVECCGILVGQRVDAPAESLVVVVEAVLLKNVYPGSQRSRFSIDAEEFLRHEKNTRRKGCEVVGFFHSHPDRPAVPSQYDIKGAWPGYVNVIVSICNGRSTDLRAWNLQGGRFLEVEIEEVGDGSYRVCGEP